jgi:hypothetical protein
MLISVNYPWVLLISTFDLDVSVLPLLLRRVRHFTWSTSTPIRTQYERSVVLPPLGHQVCSERTYHPFEAEDGAVPRSFYSSQSMTQ